MLCIGISLSLSFTRLLTSSAVLTAFGNPERRKTSLDDLSANFSMILLQGGACCSSSDSVSECDCR